MPLESSLLEILACPVCHAPLTEQDSPQADDGPRESAATQESEAPEYGELLCTGQGCGLAYPVRDGIAVLLVDEARRPA